MTKEHDVNQLVDNKTINEIVENAYIFELVSQLGREQGNILAQILAKTKPELVTMHNEEIVDSKFAEVMHDYISTRSDLIYKAFYESAVEQIKDAGFDEIEKSKPSDDNASLFYFPVSTNADEKEQVNYIDHRIKKEAAESTL